MQMLNKTKEEEKGLLEMKVGPPTCLMSIFLNVLYKLFLCVKELFAAFHQTAKEAMYVAN